MIELVLKISFGQSMKTKDGLLKMEDQFHLLLRKKKDFRDLLRVLLLKERGFKHLLLKTAHLFQESIFVSHQKDQNVCCESYSHWKNRSYKTC